MEESSTDGDYEAFRQKLLNAKSKDRRGKEGIGGRYAVFDVEYELESGEGLRNKITFISWSPDDAPQYVSFDVFPPPPFFSHFEAGLSAFLP